jgi:hypothetical protein
MVDLGLGRPFPSANKINETMADTAAPAWGTSLTSLISLFQ